MSIPQRTARMPNHLATETSPYLQQHADNPVEWYPWGEQALTLAREQNKPILLSIGYSACHWCHVMAHESFEDEAVAAVMNRHFVNIKVDREERPDLDQIYQTAHYMLTQKSGGWPLTMFLTPEQQPFFGGTYFPKTPRYNLPGFPALVERVAEFYHTRQDDIQRQNASLAEAFGQTLPQLQALAEFDRKPFSLAYQELKQSFDPVFGGFSGAPKFPRPTELEFLLRYAASSGEEDARTMAAFTLQQMADGGIYDQLGGGFCRYSVDERWLIPHFEKMLYDNGPLLSLYADVYIATGGERFKQVAQETAAWTMREMQSPQGGYYSSLDADSEHEEGKFYVWTPQQVAAVLSSEEYAVVAPHCGLDGPPNFENSHWHLYVAKPLDAVAMDLDVSPEHAGKLLASARSKLFESRERRVRPGRDEKILVSWNALMIKGMARAGRVFGQRQWLESAFRAVDFIRGSLWHDGRLLATFKDGYAHLNAYLDDHAFLLDALLELMQTQFRSEDLDFATSLAEVLLKRFEDTQQGGFFFTSNDHESLIHRPKPPHDNATPSGNGIAATALQRLGHLLGEQRYLAACERTLRLYYPSMAQQPAGFMSLLTALEEHIAPPRIVILRGGATPMEEWRDALVQHCSPDTMTLALPSALTGLPAALDKPVSGAVGAWVCQGAACLPVIDNLPDLLRVCRVPGVA
jgi:uncharacterized protein YyaL (SSP411 family)